MKRTVEQFIQEVCGTCDGGFNEEESDDVSFMVEVEESIFRCECCDWWFENEDKADNDCELLCLHCNEEVNL